MKLKSLMLTGALALSSAAVLSAKSYEIILTAPTQAGTLQLKQGEYRVKVEGASAVFTNVDTGDRYTTPVKVEKTAKKFDQTAVESTKRNGTDQIRHIDLGGSSTELDFGGD